MKLLLLIINLTATVLSLGMLSCSNRKDEVTPISATGSYKLDGVLKQCKVSAYVRNANSNTQLTISLSTMPEPRNGPEAVQLFYTKLPGQPNATYQMVSTTLAAYNSSNSNISTSYAAKQALLTITKDSLCSGTFGGISLTFGNNSIISDGVFNNVQL
jgi:hypothetical protein